MKKLTPKETNQYPRAALGELIARLVKKLWTKLFPKK